MGHVKLSCNSDSKFSQRGLNPFLNRDQDRDRCRSANDPACVHQGTVLSFACCALKLTAWLSGRVHRNWHHFRICDLRKEKCRNSSAILRDFDPLAQASDPTQQKRGCRSLSHPRECLIMIDYYLWYYNKTYIIRLSN